MNKAPRQIAIKQVITQRPIATQDELCKALRGAGFRVTQATLSRDLKELRIAHVSTPEGSRYVLNPESEERRMQSFIAYEIESIFANESVIVIKTLPGRAQGVAEIIDSFHLSSILGTLAGDNTIFVSPTSVRKISELLKSLRSLLTQTKRVA
jgi:transcriptional regulator of arginine metabolism